VGSSSSSTGSRGFAGAAGTGGRAGVGIAAGDEDLVLVLALGAATRLMRPISPSFLFAGVRCLVPVGPPNTCGRRFGRCHPHAATPASVLESIQF
jgi:hypothetical protein